MVARRVNGVAAAVEDEVRAKAKADWGSKCWKISPERQCAACDWCVAQRTVLTARGDRRERRGGAAESDVIKVRGGKTGGNATGAISAGVRGASKAEPGGRCDSALGRPTEKSVPSLLRISSELSRKGKRAEGSRNSSYALKGAGPKSLRGVLHRKRTAPVSPAAAAGPTEKEKELSPLECLAMPDLEEPANSDYDSDDIIGETGWGARTRPDLFTGSGYTFLKLTAPASSA